MSNKTVKNLKIGEVRYVMEKIIIYGSGNTGKGAYFSLKNRYECLFFVDSDENKWGKEIDGVEIKPPSILKQVSDAKVLIASVFWQDILQSLQENIGLSIAVYNPIVEFELTNSVGSELNTRTIDLGDFFLGYREIICKELTFMPGSSGILDYAFIKMLVEKYDCRNYLEIGTYIGESINILTDYCEKLYSITAEKESPYSMKFWCKEQDLPDYSQRLTYNDKIIQFFTDSKSFEFSLLKDEIDLYFIDGDHSYNGVYSDTKKIFKIKKENAIVVWHDFRKAGFKYNEEVVKAVKDVLGDKFKNVFVTNRNMCGVYLPDNYINDFKLHELKYEENADLFTFDVVLKNCQIK